MSTNTISVTAIVGTYESAAASLTRVASVINSDSASTNLLMFDNNPTSVGCNWIGNNQIQLDTITGKTYYFKLSFDAQIGFSLANITLSINGISEGIQFSRVTNGTSSDPDIDTFFIFKWTSNITGTVLVNFYTIQTAAGGDSYCIILSN
jgi:hypothetical protein